MKSIATMLPRRAVLLSVVTVLGVLGTAGAANAATFTVTTTNDSNDGACTASLCSLRDAVVAADTAGGSNTILVGPGTYTYSIASTGTNDPTTGDLDINNDSSVTITGAGSGQTVINPNGVDRAFAVQSGATLTLSGMTIELGQPSSSSSGSSDGGAVWADGLFDVTGDVVFNDNAASDGGGGAIYLDSDQGSPNTITGATFTRNSSDEGGAINDDSSDLLSITNTSFANNTSSDEGGAIYGDADGGMTITGGSFTDNDAVYGGGFYWDGSSTVSVTGTSFTGNAGAWEAGGAVFDEGSTGMTLQSDTFTGNYAGYGGALYLDSSSGNYTLDHDEFDDNSASFDGGAVYWIASSLSATRSSFIGNIANEGGGLFTCSSGQLTLTDATISLNNAAQGGGVDLNCDDPPAAMINNTIAFNTAGVGHGGGVYETSAASNPTSGPPGLENTIIAENTGGDCGDSSGTTQFAAAVDSGNNLDSDSSCFGGLGVAGDKTGVNPLLAQPANNGGSVLTDAELPGSPAIDAGSNANCAVAPYATDARDIMRPQGASCDMGAYELAPAVLAMSKTAPANGTTNVPISYTLTINNGGPGPSSATTLVDQLPAGETLFGTNPSQGSCTSAGTPAKVTCNLGVMNPAGTATVTIIAAEANVGSVTNAATVSNDQGSSVTASATTMFTAASSSATTPPTAITGRAKKIHHKSAVITGTVKTGGFGTEYFFEVGRTKSYGTVTKLKHTTKGTLNVSATLKKLRPGTKYHYRLVAVNSDGTGHGRDRTFKTTGHIGKLVLDSLHLTGTNGLVAAPLTCDSSLACHGLFSITTDSGVNGQTATVVCTVSHSTNYKIDAGKTDTIHAQLTAACLSLLEAAPGHTITAKFSSRARSGQFGVIKIITLSLG